MKRLPIARRTPLKASNTPLKRSSIRRRSKRTEALYAGDNGRRSFVAVFLADNPRCQIQWEHCTEGSQDVHEWWTRGTGGAIVPGDKADRQQQKFFAVCRRCHTQLDEQPKRAKLEGYMKGIATNGDG